MKCKCWLIFGFALLCAAPLTAIAEVLIQHSHWETRGEPTFDPVVLLRGEIIDGDLDRVVQALADVLRLGTDDDDTQQWKLILNSTGGDVVEAMKIGRFIRQNLMITQISGKYLRDDNDPMGYYREEAVCYSACFLIFVAGIERIGGYEESLGVHRPRYDESKFGELTFEEAQEAYAALDKEVRNYLHEMEVSTRIIDLMFSKPSSEMLILSTWEFRELWEPPATYDEWIRAKCPIRLTSEEERDRWNRKPEFSQGYVDYLWEKSGKQYDCESAAREAERTEGKRLLESLSNTD